MAAAQDVPRLVLQAILASQSPHALPQQRKEAVAFLEQFKCADVASVFSACAALISLQQLAQQYGALLQPTDVVGVRLAAYQLIIDAVRNRWRELSPEQRMAVTQLALQQFSEAVPPAQGPAASAGGSVFPERGKAAELLAVVVRQQGTAAYTELMPQLMAGAAGGPVQAELTCRVLLYISEDLTQFEVSGPGGAVGASGDGATADATSPGSVGTADTPDVTSKRAFLSALTASATMVFPFLCEVLEQHFQATQKLRSEPLPPVAVASAASAAAAPGSGSPTMPPEQQRREQIAAHVAALTAALGALSTWVEWVPMRRLAASSVLGACTFFIREGTPALRMQALDVLRQITWRKRANENLADYTALMDSVGGALLSATAALGLLLGPQDPLSPAMVRELGYGGSQTDFGARVLEVVEGLGDHFRALSEPEGRRAAFLAQHLTFTRHPYLRLSGGTLTLWQQLLREATPQHALAAGVGGSGGGGGGASGVAGGSVSGGSQGSTAGGGGKGASQGQPYSLPVDVVSELMRVLCGTMARVVPTADPGVGNVPDWCDSHAEYKDVVVSYRSQAKAILRLAASLAPEQALQAAGALLSSALAACTAPSSAAATASPSPTAQLEAAVVVLTAMLAPLCDLAAAAQGVLLGGGGCTTMAAAGAGPFPAAAAAASSPAAQQAAAALVGNIAELLQAVLRLRLSDPRHMTLHAEAIEAFGRFLALRPDLAVPTVSCCLEVMGLLPLEAPGQLPPPARQSPEWRAQFEARLAMANVLPSLAKAFPGALVPHLAALVAEIRALWERGLLREGERVLLWEGLLAAAAAATPHVQSQLVELIFGPIAHQWASAEWQATVSSPQAFVQAYLPLIPAAAAGGAGSGAVAAAANGDGGGGAGSPSLELGARERRWTLYHQVTLLERAMRRTAAPGGSASGGGGGGRGSGGGAANVPPASDHPFSPHLEWCLPPVARLVACIHALADPRVRPSLGPLSLVNEMDALERASRLGEDRDVVKATEQSDHRCVAGANIADARYFVRGIRECCYMVLNLATLHCGPALWRSSQLAALLPAAVTGGAPALGDWVVRLLVRHVLTPWALRCPLARAGGWMVPLCGVFLPHMHERLSSGWTALQAGTNGGEGGGAAAGSGLGAAAGGGAGDAGVCVSTASTSCGVGGGAVGGSGADATTDEVLRELLLRELSREYLGFLNALATRRPVDEGGATQQPLGANQTPNAPAGVGVGGGGGGGGAGGGPLSPRVSANGAGGGSSGVPQECILEVLLRVSPAAAQSGLVSGVAALCWPDTESASRAVNFCRALLALAHGGHSGLEGVVLGAVTRSAISSLGLVSTVMVQAQVLELLRSVLAAYLPPSQAHAPLLRAVLGELPGVTPQVLDNFTVSFCATAGDKEQRALIKKLLTAVGGDEVRKLLAAVSKLPAGVTAVPEPKQRDRGPISDITPQDLGLPHLFDLPDVQ